MPVLRQRLQQLYLDQQQDVKKTRQALTAFSASLMHPVPTVFRSRLSLRVNLSVDHNLFYPEVVTTRSVSDIAVGHGFKASFSIQKTGLVGLATDQNLVFSDGLATKTDFGVTQETPLSYSSVATGTTTAVVTAPVPIDVGFLRKTSLFAPLVNEASLTYTSFARETSLFDVRQDQQLAGSFAHATLLRTPVEQEHGFALAFSCLQTSRYTLTVNEDLAVAFVHRADLQAWLTGVHRLAATYRLRLSLQTNLGQSHGLRYKSLNTVRLAAPVRQNHPLGYRTSATARFNLSLKVSAVLSVRLRVTDKTVLRLTTPQTLRINFVAPTRFSVPLRAGATLRQSYAHTARLFTYLQSATPLKPRFTSTADLRANLAQVGFLRVRSVRVVGFYLRLTVPQSAAVKIIAREIVRTPLVQAQPVIKKALLTETTRLPFRQGQRIAIAFKHAPVLNTFLAAIYEPETYPLLARMNPVPTYAQRVAINNYVKALKANGAWALMDYLYIFAAANTANANLNWVSDTKYPAVPQNSPTFTAGKGYTFGGILVASSVDTGLNPATRTSLFSQNSAHLYVRTLSNIAVLNAQDTGNANSFINSKAALNLASVALNSAAGLNLSTTDAGAGPFAVNRSNANSFDGYSKNAGPMTMTSPSVTPANANLTIGGGLSVISSRQVAAAAAGSAMTTAQMQAFIAQTETLLSALGAI